MDDCVLPLQGGAVTVALHQAPSAKRGSQPRGAAYGGGRGSGNGGGKGKHGGQAANDRASDPALTGTTVVGGLSRGGWRGRVVPLFPPPSPNCSGTEGWCCPRR